MGVTRTITTKLFEQDVQHLEALLPDYGGNLSDVVREGMAALYERQRRRQRRRQRTGSEALASATSEQQEQ